jgi:hypothetical protein
MRGNAQAVFVDTPGIFAPKRLDRAMVAAAWAGRATPTTSCCGGRPRTGSTQTRAIIDG